MSQKQNLKSPARLLRRAVSILRTEGPKRFINRCYNRMIEKTGQGHAYVWKYCYDENHPPRINAKIDNLEIKRLTTSDCAEIDEIAIKDEWGQKRSLFVEDIEAGHHCYVAKYKGQIVACNHAVVGEVFWDRVWLRTFKLAESEAYFWQGWCIPEYRGNQIMPFLLLSNGIDIAKAVGRSEFIGWTWTSNKKMMRSIANIGPKIVGRLGFFEFFGIRFSYLWGRDAFRESRNRFLVHIR